MHLSAQNSKSVPATVIVAIATVVTFISYLEIVVAATATQSATIITIIKLVIYTAFITNYYIQTFATLSAWH